MNRKQIMKKYYKEFKENPFEIFVEVIEKQAKKEIFDDLDELFSDDETLLESSRFWKNYKKELKEKHLGEKE